MNLHWHHLMLDCDPEQEKNILIVSIMFWSYVQGSGGLGTVVPSEFTCQPEAHWIIIRPQWSFMVQRTEGFSEDVQRFFLKVTPVKPLAFSPWPSTFLHNAMILSMNI